MSKKKKIILIFLGLFLLFAGLVGYSVYKDIRMENQLKKEIFAIDFQNDGEFVGGCIAGGKLYCHINAAGDVEPCVFIHYSGANINEHSLFECLTQPLFMKYHEGQPFNDNHLRPCPMLENPEILSRIVEESGAGSTDLEAPESAEHLCSKCIDYAENWAPVAEAIWQEEHECSENA